MTMERLQQALSDLTAAQLYIAELVLDRIVNATPAAIEACAINWTKMDWAEIDWAALVDTDPKTLNAMLPASPRLPPDYEADPSLYAQAIGVPWPRPEPEPAQEPEPVASPPAALDLACRVPLPPSSQPAASAASLRPV